MMNPAIEQTVVSLFSDLRPQNNITLSLDVLESVEQIVIDSAISKTALKRVGSSFRGMGIIKVYLEGDVKCHAAIKKCLTNNDKKLLKDWIGTNNHSYYIDGYYRLDFNKFIFIFKQYKFNKNEVLIGHMLEKEIPIRIFLMEERQNFLMKYFK